MNTAVKSHFRASNNAAIKTREVRQKISSQWGSLKREGIGMRAEVLRPRSRVTRQFRFCQF